MGDTGGKLWWEFSNLLPSFSTNEFSCHHYYSGENDIAIKMILVLLLQTLNILLL